MNDADTQRLGVLLAELLTDAVRDAMRAPVAAVAEGVADDRYVLSVEQAAEFLNRSEKTVREAIHAGEIRHLRSGRRLLVTKPDCIAWVEQQIASQGGGLVPFRARRERTS